MAELSDSDFIAAAAGQPTSRELTREELQLIKGFKDMQRERLFNPPCECDVCLLQYRTKDQQDIIHWYYVQHLKDPAQLAQFYSRSINQDREFVHQKISMFGISILKRWRASEAKRKEFLKQAQPDIYPVAHPLIDFVSRGSMKLNEQRRNRAAYPLPYVNLEDLSKDAANLIRLLHHRVSFPPEDWVHFDNAQLQPPWKQGAFAEKSADGCIMMCDPEYGVWKEFNATAVHRGDAYGAPRGLMILEAQQLLMSFLRNIVGAILKDARPSNGQESQKVIVATASVKKFDLTSCNKWMQFTEAEQHRDHHWLSYAAFYSQQPYSRPPQFDIDAIIDIAEDKTLEAQDELWLLQTDLEYFYDLVKRHEREWLDSVPGIEQVRQFSTEEKMDNIGYSVTVKRLIQSRDWKWLLDECQILKREIQRSRANTLAGEAMPVAYEQALCGVRWLLTQSQKWYQASLLRLFVKSHAFQSVVDVVLSGEIKERWAIGFIFKDYPQLYEKDRIGWCLFNLTKDSKDFNTFEHSVVLQHLERFLESCPRKEVERIDPEMYRCISDMAAVERMLSILDLHRPNSAYLSETLFFQPRQVWQVHFWLLINPSDMTCAQMDLGSTLESSAHFRTPMGRRDEQWLAHRDRAQKNLNDLWKKARLAYQLMLQASEVPQKFIEPQLAMMRQGDSSEHEAQLDLDRQQILERVQAVRQEALSKIVIPPKHTTGNFTAQHDLPPYRIQEPVKEKIKTRPEGTSASTSLHKKYAAAFANLAVDEEIKEAAKPPKPPPVLYTLKQNSVARQVIPLMFPDRSMGIEEGGKTVDWLDFVATMDTLGFTAEHRGGSAFTFKVAVRLPSDPSTVQKKSIGVHMPHPSTKIDPILLQSLGRRCNRRFGWQRANFAVDEGGVKQGS